MFTMRVEDVRLRFFPSAVSTILWENRQAFRHDRDFLRRYLRPADIFVDVGANIGYLTITGAKAVGPAGKVMSFEPHPRTFRYLENNVALNRLSNVALRNLAVGNARGYVDFLECDGDDSQNCVAHGKGAIAIPMIPLDEAIIPRAPIALLKIDVEGYEKFVLEGARGVLSIAACVYFECCEGNFARYGYSCRSLLIMLQGAGFAIFRLEQGTCRPLSPDYRSTVLFENLIAVRNPSEFFARTGYQPAC